MIADPEQMPDQPRKKAKKPKPLIGLGISIVKEQPDGSKKSLGVVVAPNLDKLKEALQFIHAANIEVNLTSVRPWEISSLDS